MHQVQEGEKRVILYKSLPPDKSPHGHKFKLNKWYKIESEIQDDKQCWSEMRIVEWHRWTKKDSVALAIFAAELVIDNFEKEYPEDDRPRKAIEAAKAVLQSDTVKRRSAARSAAWSAWSAGSAAWSGWSSGSAWSAESIESTEPTAWYARSAAWHARSAALEEIYQKCHDFVIEGKFK